MTEHRFHSRLLCQHLHVVGKVVFFLYVCLKAVWDFVKVVFPNATYEAGRLGRKTLSVQFMDVFYHRKMRHGDNISSML